MKLKTPALALVGALAVSGNVNAGESLQTHCDGPLEYCSKVEVKDDCDLEEGNPLCQIILETKERLQITYDEAKDLVINDSEIRLEYGYCAYNPEKKPIDTSNPTS